jgi:hypothetical protein
VVAIRISNARQMFLVPRQTLGAAECLDSVGLRGAISVRVLDALKTKAHNYVHHRRHKLPLFDDVQPNAMLVVSCFMTRFSADTLSHALQ